MYRSGRPNWPARVLNRISAGQFGSGFLAPDTWVTLEVIGRRSGQTVACPLVVTVDGGNRYLVSQFEYAIPIAHPFILAFFVDAGNTYSEGEGPDIDTLRVAAGVEARLFLPVFQAPLRFILGRPIRDVEGDRTNGFQFSIGTSF